MRYQRMKRTLGNVLALLVMVGLLSGCNEAVSETPEPMPVKPVKLLAVEDYVLSSSDNFLAEIDATNRAQLSFQVGGEVQQLNVRMGQRVAEGDVLATLDDSDLTLSLDSAKASYSLARTQWERSQRLYAKKLVSTDVYEQAETNYKAERARYEQARTELGYTQLIAPFDGVVSYTFVKPNQVVAAKQQILNIIDNTKLDVSFTMPVSFVEKMGIANLPAQTMWLSLDSEPNVKIPGAFKEISTQPNTDTNTYQATMTVVRPEHRNLLIGMTGQVHIVRLEAGLQLSLPESAWVSRNDSEGTVWVMDPSTHRVAKAAVSLTPQGKILSGLDEKDLVVVAGVETLHEGQEVKAWEREEGI
ncbi:efflux RND transporter periplasmic adaptor subunit [Grimontia kaedaensis]|uniref:Efflux RND transporter periplasmic adaptor subunit n=1 Tax=Grimontia kaedaensis TaxID=2872157 RepID=A0ABY4X2H2_9GAMM|nr:efflux RND transporter periplasmic adaptor subunit [Grimontia kaedaensis]